MNFRYNENTPSFVYTGAAKERAIIKLVSSITVFTKL
jgi:hypothetical protein